MNISLRTVLKYITNSDYRFIANGAYTKIYDNLSDEEYLKRLYRCRLGYDLNLETPTSFNEKINWLKLHDRKEYYSKLVDKQEVKTIVADKIGAEHVIPTIAVYDDFDDIDKDMLPDQFVMKCTHDSGSVMLVNDKKDFNWGNAGRRIKKTMARDYFYLAREWSYKNIKPRIIIEKLMKAESDCQLADYKIFNFSGESKFIEVDFDRFTRHKRNIYDTDWNLISASIEYPSDPNRIIEKPEKLAEMLEYASILSKGIPFLRTDFYYIDGNIFFGELTFYPDSGFGRFDPEEFGLKMGELIQLPQPIT